MPKPAPHGPLVGDELARAQQCLTAKQFAAYRLRREANALNWIAQRLGVSRRRVVLLVAAAEQRLGYAPTVAPKQKAPYKGVARRKAEKDSAERQRYRQLLEEMTPEDQRWLVNTIQIATSDQDAGRREQATERLRMRLRQFERERQERDRRYLPYGAEHDDDWSSAVGQNEAEFQATLEADFGPGIAPEDFVADDGRGATSASD